MISMWDTLTRSPAISAVEHLQRTEADGRTRHTTIVRPSIPSIGTVVLFHPFTFDRESVLLGEPPGERLITALPGMAVPAAMLGITLVSPYSGGRSGDGVSLAWHEHIDGAVRLAMDEAAGNPVGSAGLSQGGLEALVAAGRHSESIDAVHAVNAVVDVARWYDDMGQCAGAGLAEAHARDLIRHEIGGTPKEVPAEYAARSPFSYIAQLGRVASTIVWTPEDSVVAGQAHHHSGRLCDALRRAGGSPRELITTHILPGTDAGRFAHESCDVWEVVGFFADRWTRPTAAQPTHPGSSGTYLPVEGS
jgi:pimeloyl-ACP methyl ester carboxylesterase